MSGFGRTSPKTTASVEVLERAIDETGGRDARVGDEHGPFALPSSATSVPEPRDRARPVHEPRRNLDRPHRLDLDRHPSLLSLSSVRGER